MMKRTFSTARLLGLVLLGLGVAGKAPSWGQEGEGDAETSSATATDGAGGDAKEQSADGEKAGERSRHREGQDDLSREEHERLRRLLQQVWDDPAVIESRDEVRTASENFRRLLHARIKALDPEAAELMEKVSARSRFSNGGMGDGKSFGGGPGRPGRSEGAHAGLEYMAKPSFYASLTEEQRETYDAAYKKALASGALDRVKAELLDLRSKDEALRKLRTDQFRRARALLKAAMVEADPEVEALFPEREEGDRKSRGEGGGKRPAQGAGEKGKAAP